MTVRVNKTNSRELKSEWKLSPMAFKPNDMCFSVTRKRYLWFKNIIVGYKFTLPKTYDVSFATDKLDLSGLEGE